MLISQWLRTTFPIRGRAQCDQMKSGMHTRNAVHGAAFFASTLLARSVRVVTRDQEIVGADVEDSVITAEVKRRLASNKAVDASSISVETRRRIVMLPGFAQYAAERTTAECLVWKVKVAKAMRWLQDAVCSRASGISAPACAGWVVPCHCTRWPLGEGLRWPRVLVRPVTPAKPGVRRFGQAPLRRRRRWTAPNTSAAPQPSNSALDGSGIGRLV